MAARSLSDEIAQFFSDSRSPVLFAGAGVSARAGLPVWPQYLDQLAELIRRDEPLTAQQMREAVRDTDYLVAASYYFLARKVRRVELLKNLALPLEKYDVQQVASVGGLPFNAYVTTNFDKVLLDVFASSHSQAPTTFNLGDPALASAACRDDFFVARIHGRVEAPDTMVLSQQHYDQLASQRGYVALLRHILSFKQVLFVGFSFLDPAIRKVLDLVNSEMGPLTEGLHLAILPEGVSDEYTNRLERLNIRRVFYNPADSHRVLWESLREAARQLSSRQLSKKKPNGLAEPLALAKRYLASCYARTQLQKRITPLSH